MLKQVFLFLGVALVALGSGCSGASEATPTPMPTLTPVATPILMPTLTPVLLPTPTTVPATHYVSSLGVSADLPGKDWILDKDVSDGGLKHYFSNNTNASLIFTVAKDVKTVVGSEVTLSQYIAGWISGAYAPPVAQTNEDFHGYQAVRLEGSFKQGMLPNDYRLVQYVFLSHGQMTFVTAGSLVTNWDGEGKEAVESMLSSVSLK